MQNNRHHPLPNSRRTASTLCLGALGFVGLLAWTAPAKGIEMTSAEAAGWYLGIGGGYSSAEDIPADNPALQNTIDPDDGYAAAARIGYDSGAILRGELELALRDNDTVNIDSVQGQGDIRAYSYMANVYAELKLDAIPVTPFVGVGVGAATVDMREVRTVAGSQINNSDTGLAYQAIAGLAVNVTDTMSLTGAYTYLEVPDLSYKTSAGGELDSDYSNHTFMLGLRWRFLPAAVPEAEAEPSTAVASAPAPAKPAAKSAEQAPAPVAAPAPMVKKPGIVREFMVFFDWDKSVITEEARLVLENAARHAQRGGVVAIGVTGHSDSSGSASYNEKLSLARAKAVKDVLVDMGLSSEEVTTYGKGETVPLIQTADGIREAKNRRAVIVLN